MRSTDCHTSLFFADYWRKQILWCVCSIVCVFDSAYLTAAYTAFSFRSLFVVCFLQFLYVVRIIDANKYVSIFLVTCMLFHSTILFIR